MTALAVFLRPAIAMLRHTTHGKWEGEREARPAQSTAVDSVTFCGLCAILGRKAFGFRSSVVSMAALRSAAFSMLLQQLWQLQLSQYSPEAKHSQYLCTGNRGRAERRVPYPEVQRRHDLTRRSSGCCAIEQLLSVNRSYAQL